MSVQPEQVARADRPALSAGRAAWLPLTVILVLTGACSGDSQPDPPDTGGAAAAGECPSGLPSDADCTSSAPSYTLAVAPIVEQRCAGCHYPGNTQSGNEFSAHEDIYPVRQTVLTRIYTCAMPPDGAPSLTLEERRTLLQWFVCGAPDN